MATKTGSGEAGERDNPGGAEGAGDALRESAERIWLAGLGAFERMKSEGPRMFETLVEQGRSMSAQAKDAADKALRGMREANYEGAGRWEKFEQALQERVSKSLNGLGVMTNREVEALSKQVAELNEHVRELMTASVAATASAAGKRSTGTRKAARTHASRSHATRKASGTARSKAGPKAGTRKAAAGRSKAKKRSAR